jgi:hypothetical protein
MLNSYLGLTRRVLRNYIREGLLLSDNSASAMRL